MAGGLLGVEVGIGWRERRPIRDHRLPGSSSGGSGFGAALQTSAGHALAQATVFKEIPLESANLPVEKVVGLMDEAEGDISDGASGPSLDEETIGLIRLRSLPAQASDVECLSRILGPDGKVGRSKVIFVVAEKFLETGASYVGELDLGLFGGPGCFRAFEDVLFAGAGSSPHLVDGAVASLEEALRESEGEIENDLGLLGEELSVISMWWKKRNVARKGHRSYKSYVSYRTHVEPNRFLSALLLLALFLSQSSGCAKRPLQEQSEQFFPLARGGFITLENTDGSIHVYGWDEPRVRLAALRRAYTGPRLEQVRIETIAEEAALTVRTIVPKASGLFADRSGTVDYTLTVPESARLKLKLVNGEISLQGLRGAEVDLELGNGRIIALNCYAQVRARSKNGVLEAFFEWWENLPATFDYALERGRIGVRLPRNARFRVDARTGDGWIHQQFGFGAPAKIGSGQSLEAATAPDAPVSLGLRTGGGNISLDAIR